MDEEEEEEDQHHSDDSCLLHEFTSPTCSRSATPGRSRPAAARGAAPRRRGGAAGAAKPCCSASSACLPRPILTSSRRPSRLASVDDLSQRLEGLRRELRNAVPGGDDDDDEAAAPPPHRGCCCCAKWEAALLSALRRDPDSLPERRSDGAGGGTRVRQPGRADVRFAPRKGDVIIHHEKRPGRKVLEFYDPVCQRLRDGDILVRFKLDSYACEGLVMVKGCGYIYHRGFWVYLGKDSDQIARSCNW